MYKLNELKRRLFSLYKRCYWSVYKKRKNQQIVFVAGMQRSGTNMLMNILEQSIATDVYHERDPRAFDNYKMKDLGVINSLIQQSKEPAFVIKSLFELQDLKDLQNRFPHTQIIWIVRDYNDTVNSMNVSFNNMEKQVLRIVNNNTDEWFAQGISEKTLQILNDVVYPGLGDPSAAALQWYFRNILFFEQEFHNNKNVLLVPYEQLVNHPQTEIRKICHFIDLTYTSKMANKIFSSSINKKNSPELDANVNQLCHDLQKRFKTQYEV